MNHANSIEIDRLEAVAFSELLRVGAESPVVASEDVAGWHEMRDGDLKVAVLDLAKHMDVFEGTDRMTGPVPSLILPGEAQELGIQSERGPELTVSQVTENLANFSGDVAIVTRQDRRTRRSTRLS
jgi:hypothetical protein